MIWAFGHDFQGPLYFLWSCLLVCVQMRMGFSMGMESILVISLSNLYALLQRQPDQTDIFVICLVIGFEVDEVDSLVMRIVSVVRKLFPAMS
jgi:uncharacterized membrane protein YczE